MQRSMLAILLICIPALLAACSGGSVETDGHDGDGGAGGTGPEPDEVTPACVQHAEASCAKQLECYGLSAEIRVGPLEKCSERVAEQCVYRAKQPGSGLSAAVLSACTAAQSAAGCGLSVLFPKECQFTGTHAYGEACSDGAQCQSGVCDAKWADGCGTCDDAKVAEGGDCTDYYACAAGLYCNMATQKCAPLGEEGAACTGAQCISYLDCRDGQCSAGAAAGEPCTDDSDCNNTDVLWCDPETLTCAERPIGGGCYWQGATCGYANNCLGDLCNAAPKEGEGCGSDGYDCIYPAECRNSICTLDYPICSP